MVELVDSARIPLHQLDSGGLDVLTAVGYGGVTDTVGRFAPACLVQTT